MHYNWLYQLFCKNTFHGICAFSEKKQNLTHPKAVKLATLPSCYYAKYRGVPRIWEGGGQEFFFSDLGICMSQSDMLRMAKPCALLGGFGGMLPREIFLKRCNLVRFRVYFDQILSLFFSKNAIFYIKNKYFIYTFVMGYFS